MNNQPPSPRSNRSLHRGFLILLVVGCVAGIFIAAQLVQQDAPLQRPEARTSTEPRLSFPPHMRLAAGRKLTAWWDGPTDLIRSRSIAGTTSNIRPVNYTGPDACAKCHPGNFEDWSHHPHRWMNVPASSATVRADFSPGAEIAYRGGKATFRQSGGKYQMHLVRDGVARTYEITQTIGSRFYQYFVGKQTEGPEPPEHHFYHKDHVLPFGYWLAKKEWVPVVHIGPEKPDDLRPDPYRPPDRGLHYAEYAASCNYCHTTFALGDLMARRPEQLGE